MDCLSEGPLENHELKAGGRSAKAYGLAALRRLRGSQPFNYFASSAVNGLFAATGWRSELVIKHLHRIGHVKRILPNGRTLRLWSLGDDWISNQVYWRGWAGYEPETVPLFYRLATRARVTLDVGAYVGFYALLAGHANPAGRVYAFEPLATAYERLQKNIKLNRLANTQCIGAAVGDSDGESDFYYGAGNMPCSSSLSLEFMGSVTEVKVARVPTVTLDGFLHKNRIGPVDLMKIDTETTEPQVLGGMTESLRRDTPAIICEVLGRGSEEALERLLGPFGYRFYHLTPDGPVLRDRIEGHPTWLNYLFTRLGADEVSRI